MKLVLVKIVHDSEWSRTNLGITKLPMQIKDRQSRNTQLSISRWFVLIAKIETRQYCQKRFSLVKESRLLIPVASLSSFVRNRSTMLWCLN